MTWNFLPIQTAWDSHMAEYSKMTEQEIDEQLQTPPAAQSQSAEQTVCNTS